MAHPDPPGPSVPQEDRALDLTLDRAEEALRAASGRLLEVREEIARVLKLIDVARRESANGGRARAPEPGKLPVSEYAWFKRHGRARERIQLHGRRVGAGDDGKVPPQGHTVTLLEGSAPFVAYRLLEAEGRALHVEEIVERMLAAGHETQKDSLVAALARLAAKGAGFCRVPDQPNTFGLHEWSSRKKGRVQPSERK